MSLTEFYVDQNGVPKVARQPRRTLLASYLEEDVQSSPRTCDLILEVCEAVGSGKQSHWEETGNAHTLTLDSNGAAIEHEYLPDSEKELVPMDDFTATIIAWRAFVEPLDRQGP